MAQRKETKKKIKARDLKPKKDAKGGMVQNVNQTRQQSHSGQRNQAHQPKLHI